MTSQVLIFDLNGNQVATLETNVRRTWKLNEYESATFTLSGYDAKAILSYVQFGRFIYVNHAKLGEWAGMIDPPRSWGYHKFEVTAYSGEYILTTMRTPLNWTGDGHPGPLSSQLVTQSDGRHDILQIGNISDNGKAIKRESHLAIVYDEIKQWAKEAHADWDVTATVINGKITFYLNWYDKKGETRLIPLDENLNLQLSDNIMVEQGTLANDLIGYDSTEKSWNNCMKSHRLDQTSIDEYGPRYSAFAHTVGHIQSASDKATESTLDKQKQPRKTFDFSVLDKGEIFNNLRIGDTLPVRLTSVGFSGDGFGTNTTARILGITYEDVENKAALIMDEAI
jgi:hypothetical protein